MSTRSSARSSGSTTTTVTTQRRSTTSSTARPNASTTRRSTTSTRPATTTTRRSTTSTRPTATRTTTTAAAKRKPSTTTKKSQVANDAALARAMAKADQEALDADLARVINGLSTSSSNKRSNRSSKNSPPLIFLKPPPPPSHMCFVPCVMGAGAGMERCVEMMVDTGAQSSVISLQLAQKLGLESKLDDSHQGIAAGVGRAHIVGKLRGVKCQLGQVEFNMDFSVLDVQDELLLLGMDLMRKYKCVVDLEKDVLLFGGRNGVEVPLLPPNQDQIEISNQVRNGCEIQ